MYIAQLHLHFSSQRRANHECKWSLNDSDKSVNRKMWQPWINYSKSLSVNLLVPFWYTCMTSDISFSSWWLSLKSLSLARAHTCIHFHTRKANMIVSSDNQQGWESCKRQHNNDPNPAVMLSCWVCLGVRSFLYTLSSLYISLIHMLPQDNF